MESHVTKRTRKVADGVHGLSDPIWWSDLGEGLIMKVFYNFHPKPEFITTLERKDGKPLDIIKNGKAVRLTFPVLHDLYRVTVDTLPAVRAFVLGERDEPFWPLRDESKK